MLWPTHGPLRTESLCVYPLPNEFLLLPNLDSAFDRGFITFQDDGEILISEEPSEEDEEILGIQRSMRIGGICSRHVKYLRYHRGSVFGNE